ncbi:MAG: GNAT family N-acetyltransferase [Gammaproteobacteria bacterium]|nr:MAG: GNAT family N-acetyltransferase [Gammaproteobacteria bacterium]
MQLHPIIRQATRDDLPHIIRLLANDPLGSQRECYQDPLPPRYYAAFTEIDADKNNHLIVVEFEDKIIGALQLTFIPYLTHQGSKRAQVEGVRIDEAYRGKGIGQLMMQWAIDKSRAAGCSMMQLTTDKERRPKAAPFYQKLGFSITHEGLKLLL